MKYPVYLFSENFLQKDPDSTVKKKIQKDTLKQIISIIPGNTLNFC